MEIRLLEDATRDLINRVKQIEAQSDTEYAAARAIVRLLGARYHNGYAEFGFWTPELADNDIKDESVFLEVFRPSDTLDLTTAEQMQSFTRQRVRLVRHGNYLWGVVAGMQPGSREIIGDFYQVVYQDAQGMWKIVPDYLAVSIPYGVFAPAEFYDLEAALRQRGDREYFSKLDFDPAHEQDGVGRIGPPTNILQIHIHYATPEGTLAGLTRLYDRIAGKLRAGGSLTPAEECYIGYDAVQLMPIEPIIEYEAGPGFWETQVDDGRTESVEVLLRRPDITNWGYDVVISGSTATNPALLETGRPDELLDFIAALHNFPGQPIKVMLDIVYGHIDNQALPLVNQHVFAGANMYGQNLNFKHPVTRALLLEMMRRKHNYGVDGIRVDGAQDFKNWDRETDTMIHDDDFLREMNDIQLDVAGHTYLPWMIFEDGRPWPRDDWELASSYREVTRQMPNVWQWGPLTFAHNTPFLFTFWAMKWWRVREVTDFGREWITGCANHDTLRRGSQVPTDARINTYLGNSLPEIINKAYDNPAAQLFDYAISPGVPMGFINASMHAPWGFIRNTDDRWGVKVVSEEARFTQWRINELLYNRADAFKRLKSLGFDNLPMLRTFMFTLDHAVQMTDYNLDVIVRVLNSDITPQFRMPELTVERLKAIARAWMDDVHDYCNVWAYADGLDPERTRFNLAVRRFRRQRRWLMNNLGTGELLNYRHPSSGTILYYGLRRAPQNGEAVLFVANMEGEPVTVTPLELPIPGLTSDGWEVALAVPGVQAESPGQPVRLADSEGVVYVRQPGT
ncbi:MAG: glucosylglycerol hydrolase [Chloroflexota bacterium]